MRLLVDNKGTARLSSEKSKSEDRRIHLVIRESNRYNIRVAAPQETKWFGSHVYHVGKSVVLTSGRVISQECQPRQRVAIVLTGHAVTAWKAMEVVGFLNSQTYSWGRQQVD